MEFVLNFAWLLLAAAMLTVWLRSAPAKGIDRRQQFLALLMVILILLPAISMTDDLLAAQNPAEVDCSLRRDHDHANPHSIIPAVAALLLPFFRGLSLQSHSFLAVSSLV